MDRAAALATITRAVIGSACANTVNRNNRNNVCPRAGD